MISPSAFFSMGFNAGFFMNYTTEHIKNVSIAGHGGTGKTTLYEHLLFAGGVIPRAETVESGKTLSDSSPEEVERKISIHTALAHIERNGIKINILDTPGSSDFTGDVILSFRAAEFALLVVDARSGVQIETIKLWRNLESRNKPRGIFITRIDDERANYDTVIADIKEKLKIDPVPFTIPMGNAVNYTGVVDVLSEKSYTIPDTGIEKPSDLPSGYQEAYKSARDRVSEAAAEGSDELMEEYLVTGEIDSSHLQQGLRVAVAENKIVPVFVGAALKNSGLIPFLDAISELGPGPQSAHDVASTADGAEQDVPVNPDKALAALVIKTAYDQFSGKISWLKIIQGKLSADSEVFNVSENKKERISKLYICQGKKLEEVTELAAGDIGILTKSASLNTNNTITAGDTSLSFLPLRLPEPVHSIAVNAVAKKDDDKLGDFLVRSTEEDKTFRYIFNAETKETVISGMGELHVNIILDKVKSLQKIEVETHVPRVAYRETITKGAGAEYTHKKQSGGHGQYGKVALEIAPLPRGEQYKFVNAIFGGAIPKNYMPGVEKGVVEGMAAGVMAGYPVVDVEVKITDGKYHPVDSSELSFKIAGRNAFREAMRQANPVLLEPIQNLTVFVEGKYLGDVMSDLSGKRGRILGQNSVGGIEEIRAQAPQSELLRYSIDLRSITSGTGSFSVEFAHYAPISGRIADDVIKAAAAFRVQETED
ncbi:GTP-binding protein [Spirochaetia bacterium]|nr:GTP-binding protein [Spirochaetia bacterium]GHU34150.1 GTP-binding protein [Spirochaetia bacterium]